MATTWIFVLILFWAAIGVYSIKQAMDEGNDRMQNLQLEEFFPLFLKSLFYGPMTQSRLIGGTTIAQKHANERAQYKKTLQAILTEANTGTTDATLNNIREMVKQALRNE